MNAPSERTLAAAERALKKRPRGAQKAVGGGIYLRLDADGRRRFQFRLGVLADDAERLHHRYGFDCPASGLLTRSTGSSGSTATTGSTAPAAVRVGRTVLLARRTRTKGCRRGPRPDRRCSPGAFYSRLTKP